jgi:ketosteroid isomerase-like protein
MRPFVPAVFSLVLAAGVSFAGADEDRLMRADREFARVTAERGLDGWISFFTQDATRVDLESGAIASGLKAIREHDGPLFEDGTLRLSWEPTAAGLYDGGSHGFTVGSYTLSRREGDDETVLSRGTYLTLWRLEEGRFKVYLDTGAADREDGK